MLGNHHAPSGDIGDLSRPDVPAEVERSVLAHEPTNVVSGINCVESFPLDGLESSAQITEMRAALQRHGLVAIEIHPPTGVSAEIAAAINGDEADYDGVPVDFSFTRKIWGSIGEGREYAGQLEDALAGKIGSAGARWTGETGLALLEALAKIKSSAEQTMIVHSEASRSCDSEGRGLYQRGDSPRNYHMDLRTIATWCPHGNPSQFVLPEWVDPEKWQQYDQRVQSLSRQIEQGDSEEKGLSDLKAEFRQMLACPDFLIEGKEPVTLPSSWAIVVGGYTLHKGPILFYQPERSRAENSRYIFKIR